jgi:hypothetical protein
MYRERMMQYPTDGQTAIPAPLSMQELEEYRKASKQSSAQPLEQYYVRKPIQDSQQLEPYAVPMAAPRNDQPLEPYYVNRAQPDTREYQKRLIAQTAPQQQVTTQFFNDNHMIARTMRPDATGTFSSPAYPGIRFRKVHGGFQKAE